MPNGPSGGGSAERGEPSLVVPLEEVALGDLDRVGGKGANLGELIHAGFPVPEGFVVTTAAYLRLLRHEGLDSAISEGLREGDGERIRARFEAAAVPPELEEAILASWRELGSGAVAVRSSATAEDLPNAAFAGQQETFLNVIGPEALLTAVKRCWGSLWTDRAIAYRGRLGIDHRGVRLAVVVQRMVPAEVAGVMFTSNPVTGARDEVVVDASPGLGEAVVAGLVTPDHFVLRRRWLGRWGWRVVERRRGKHELTVLPRADGGTHTVPGPGTRFPSFTLSDSDLRRLADVGWEIQDHYGEPQDIEWAWAAGRPVVLQARPITALPELFPPPSRGQRLMAGLVSEQLPARPTPLETTTWVRTVYDFLVRLFALFGLRALPLEQVFLVEDGVVVRLRGRIPLRPSLRTLTTPLRLSRLARLHDARRWQDDPLVRDSRARVAELEVRDLTTLTWPGLLASVREALAVASRLGEVRIRYVPGPILAVACLRLVLGLLGRADRFPTLVFSGVETKVLETNRALEELAARVRSDQELAAAFASHPAGELWRVLEERPAGRAFLEELERFLDEYGHREAGGTLLVTQSSWRDRPEVVLGLLQGLALADTPTGPGEAGWERARDELLGHPLLRLPPLRSAFQALLAQARLFAQIREDTRFLVMLPLPVLRRALLEMGRRLEREGVTEDAEQVFFLRWEELERIGDGWPPDPGLAGELRGLIDRRLQRYAELEGAPLVDPRLLGPRDVGGDVLLRGMPGSPGVAEGPVRVVGDPSGFGALRSGEVLVAPYTNPAWTPLFQRAAAVVVDSGGPASHAAIVAREYGIPAVMATGEGTRRLRDGQRVLVDGSQGVVTSSRE